jgi:hypothetical protein
MVDDLTVVTDEDWTVRREQDEERRSLCRPRGVVRDSIFLRRQAIEMAEGWYGSSSLELSIVCLLCLRFPRMTVLRGENICRRWTKLHQSFLSFFYETTSSRPPPEHKQPNNLSPTGR